MKPETFKKLGLKSGDRVRFQLVNGSEREFNYVRYNKGSVYIMWRDKEKCIKLQDIIDIVKLKVTKKKEKKEEIPKINYCSPFQAEIEGYNRLLDEKEKPIKSLSTLEIGDEVKNEWHQIKITNIADIDGDRVYGFDYQGEKEYASAKNLEMWSYKVVEKTSSIIDEIIAFLDMLQHTSDPKLLISVNKDNFPIFITYFKELKNKLK